MDEIREIEKQSIIRMIDEMLLKGVRSFTVKREFQEEMVQEYQSREWNVNKKGAILEFNERNKRVLLFD